MVITDDIDLPSDEDLCADEVKLSGSVLKAAAFHMGKSCENVNNEFILCREELGDPRACLAEGKAVTACAMAFFRALKRTCGDEFMQHVRCIDKSSVDQKFSRCRKTQKAYDECMREHLDMERAPYDYFARVHVHKTERPRPEQPQPAVYEDATPCLPEDEPSPPAKYGARWYLSNW